MEAPQNSWLLLYISNYWQELDDGAVLGCISSGTGARPFNKLAANMNLPSMYWVLFLNCSLYFCNRSYSLPSLNAQLNHHKIISDVYMIWRGFSIEKSETNLTVHVTFQPFTAYRQNSFSVHENKLGERIKDEWQKEAVTADEGEIVLAKANRQIFQEKPWIRVAVDGGWQKQSHGHSYNSSSGKFVAISMARCVIHTWLLTSHSAMKIFLYQLERGIIIQR